MEDSVLVSVFLSVKWEGLKKMFWGIKMSTRMGWGLVRGVLGMNVMVIILFTRALGNISDRGRDFIN